MIGKGVGITFIGAMTDWENSLLSVNNSKEAKMRYVLSGLACCIALVGCQTIPWQETGPLMKMVNISKGPEECMALADLNGKLLVTKDRILALNSHGCNSVNDKDGIKVLKADSIVIEDSGARAANIKFSWGGWSVIRNTPSSWKFIWIPPKK